MKIRGSLIAAAISLMAAIIFAGCSMISGLTGSIPGGGSSEPVNTESLEAQQKELFDYFKQGIPKIMLAQALMLDAIGLKEEAAKMRTAADEVASANNKADIEKTTAVSEEVSKKQKEELAKADVKDKQKSEKAKSALSPFLSGNAELLRIVPMAVEFGKGIADIIQKNPMSALQLKGQFEIGITLAEVLPGYAKADKEVASATIEYLKKAGMSDGEAAKLSKQAAGDAEAE